MSKFGNSKRNIFINSFKDRISLNDDNNNLTVRSKFNLSYFDSGQQAGQDFKDWTDKQLHELLKKIKEYTSESLDYWRNQRVGKGGLKVLETYGAFPKKSDFSEPKHVPHQAQWGRFRLGSKVRLIGFTVPTDFHSVPHPKTGELFDKNTFYIVFLDKDHRFYITEEP